MPGPTNDQSTPRSKAAGRRSSKGYGRGKGRRGPNSDDSRRHEKDRTDNIPTRTRFPDNSRLQERDRTDNILTRTQFPDDSGRQERDRADDILIHTRVPDDSVERPPSRQQGMPLYQPQSYHNDKNWSELIIPSSQSLPSGLNTQIDQPPQWAKQLMEQQNKLFSMLTATEKGSSQVPRYECKKLAQDATPAEVEAWIAAIQEGNRRQPGHTDAIAIQRALTQVAWEVQADWRAYRETLEHDKPGEEASLTDFWRFIRKADVDRELYERTTRLKLMELRQEDYESPMDFFSRWQFLVRKVEHPCQFEDNSRLGFEYWYKLHNNLKQALIQQGISLKNATIVSHEAEKLWSTWQRDKTARLNSMRSRDELMPVETPQGVSPMDAGPEPHKATTTLNDKRLRDELQQGDSSKNAYVPHEAETPWGTWQNNMAADVSNRRSRVEPQQAPTEKGDSLENAASAPREAGKPWSSWKHNQAGGVNKKRPRLERSPPRVARIGNAHVRHDDVRPAKMRASELNDRVMNANDSEPFRIGGDTNLRCHNCNQFGHLAMRCPENNSPRATGARNGRKATGPPVPGFHVKSSRRTQSRKVAHSETKVKIKRESE